MEYNFARIEKKWQDRWLENKTGAAVTGSDKPKFFGLIEFPYPSAQGLHVGHARPFTAMDIICRKKRMEGYNVLFTSDTTPLASPRKTLPSKITSTRRR